MKNRNFKNKGAVLLIAILVSGVALAVGLGVYNRTYKQLHFANFWKQTQVAFSAADSGLECAIYWDTQTTALTQFSCFGNPNTSWAPMNPGTWEMFGNNGTQVGGGCVRVTITKAVSPAVTTTIMARGYNTCDTANPRRVERGLGVQY